VGGEKFYLIFATNKDDSSSQSHAANNLALQFLLFFDSFILCITNATIIGFDFINNLVSHVSHVRYHSA